MKPRPELPPGPYLVVGLARSGRAAALTLRARGQRVIGLDSGEPADLDALLAAGVELHLGEQDGTSLVERAACIVKSPGVPVGVPAMQHALAKGKCVLGELELAWRLLANEFVAVTGTNGKTTTVELIGHIHRVAGVPAAVAGNVGVALSGLVGRIDPAATIVCEASSFQLEDALAFSPELAVLLNLAPDHLDRHGTFERYRQAKLRIFARQDASDTAVLSAGLELGTIPGAARRVFFGAGEVADLSLADGVLYWRGEPLVKASELRIPGRHNLQNAMAAAAACLVRGIDAQAVCEGLRSFPGVAHRLQQIAVRDGVRYVNDSKATNVASTLVALDALAGEQASVHLILGGQGKGQSFRPLRRPVERRCRAVYLIGEDAGAITEALVGIETPVRSCGTLDRAVESARELALPGDTVLLSPACASFDQFTDFEERGRRFGQLVAAH